LEQTHCLYDSLILEQPSVPFADEDLHGWLAWRHAPVADLDLGLSVGNSPPMLFEPRVARQRLCTPKSGPPFARARTPPRPRRREPRLFPRRPLPFRVSGDVRAFNESMPSRRNASVASPLPPLGGDTHLRLLPAHCPLDDAAGEDAAGARISGG
jgi:hypothetical protein